MRMLLHGFLILLLVLQPALLPSAASAEIGTGDINLLDRGMTSVGMQAGGQFQASTQTGDSSYSIPIDVPPGTNGLSPSIVLSYSSGNRSDSWAGYGWNVSGGSVISRSTRDGTPRYIDHETLRTCDAGTSAGLSCSATADCAASFCLLADSFEIDGMKLVYLGDANAGDPAINYPLSYATQNESFAVIERHSDDSWTVTDPSGTRRTYGSSVNTRTRRDGATGPIYAWHLAEQADTSGNTIDYSYHHESGTAFMEEIEYGQMPRRVVRFNLDPNDRPDQPVSYLAGFEQNLTRRLASISVQVGSGATPTSVIRRYDLGYIQSSDSARSLLDHVDFRGVGGAVPPAPGGGAGSPRMATFTYHSNVLAGTTGWAAPVAWPRSGGSLFVFGSLSLGQLQVGDVNGDGLVDVLRASKSIPPVGPAVDFQELFLNTGSGFTVSHSYPLPAWSGGDPVLFTSVYANQFGVVFTNFGQQMVDLNRDGRSDFVARGIGSAYQGSYVYDGKPAWLRSGPGSWTADGVPIGGSHLTFVTRGFDDSFGGSGMFPDLNGDGAREIAIRGKLWKVGCQHLRLSDLFYWNLGDMEFAPSDNVIEGAAGCSSGTQQRSIEYRTGGNYGSPATEASYASPDDRFFNHTRRYGVIYVDVNGDGLDDFLESRDKSGVQTRIAYLNKGDRSFELRDDWRIPTPIITGDNTENGVRFADVNGDGRVDVVRGKEGEPREAWLGDGDVDETGIGAAWVSDTNWVPPVDFVKLTTNYYASSMFIDLDGDGMVDLTSANPTTFELEARLNLGSIPDLMTRVVDTLGGAVDIEYGSSAQAIDSSISEFPNSDASDVGYLPFVKPVISAIEMDDGNGPIRRIEYAYADGHFDTTERQFYGFGRTTETVGGLGAQSEFVALARTRSTYHTDPARPGLMESATLEEPNGQGGWTPRLISTVQYALSAGSAPFVVYPECTVREEIETGGSRMIGVLMERDLATGNVLKSAELGLVTDDQCTDDLADVASASTYEYATGSSLGVTSSPSIRRDWRGNPGGGGVVFLKQQTEFRYDSDGGGLPLPIGQVEQGLPSHLVQVAVPSSTTAVGVGPTTTVSRNAVGHVVSITNARENAAEVGIGEGTSTVLYLSAVPDLPGERVSPLIIGDPATSADDHDLRTTLSYVSDSGCRVAQPTEAGRLAIETDPNGTETVYCYDEFGRTESVSVRDATTEYARATTSYDDTPGAISFTVDRAVTATTSRTTSVDLDGFGREIMRSTDGPQGNTIVETKSYDVRGQLATSSLPGFGAPGQVIEYAYDVLGRSTERKAPGNRTWSMTYSIAGSAPPLRAVVSTDPEGDSRTRFEDAFDRLVQLEEDDGVGTFTTDYTYDFAGRISWIADHHNNFTFFGYDALGRRTTVSSLDAGAATSQFDSAGNLILFTDPSGSTSYTHDAINRMLTRVSADGKSDVTNTYDGTTTTNGLGRLTRSIGEYNHTILTYDPRGNMTSSKFVFAGKQLSYSSTFDQMSRATSRTYPSGRTVSWVRDAAGYLTGISSDSGEDFATAITWSPQLDLAGWETGAGVTTDYTYDPVTQLMSDFEVAGPGGTYEDLTYAYYDDVQLKNINAGSHSSYVYDGIGRLTSATGPFADGQLQTTLLYQYDAIGNMTCMDGADAACTGGRVFQYPAPAAAPGVVLPHGPTTIDGLLVTHDAAGNLTHFNGDTYNYDDRGRLNSVDRLSVPIVTATYRPDDRVFKQTSGGTVEYRPTDDFAWDQTAGNARVHVSLDGQAIATQEESWVPPNSGGSNNCTTVGAAGFGTSPPGSNPPFTFLLQATCALLLFLLLRRKRSPDFEPAWSFHSATSITTIVAFLTVTSVPISLFTAAPAQAVSPPAVTYFHADRLGTANLTTDSLGALSGESEYRPFGAGVAATPGGTPNVPERGFTNQRFEATSGLYDYGARWYAPELGRFLQPDAFITSLSNPQSLNPYSYVANDPINLVDPTGNYFFCFASGCDLGARGPIWAVYTDGRGHVWGGPTCLGVACASIAGPRYGHEFQFSCAACGASSGGFQIGGLTVNASVNGVSLNPLLGAIFAPTIWKPTPGIGGGNSLFPLAIGLYEVVLAGLIAAGVVTGGLVVGAVAEGVMAREGDDDDVDDEDVPEADGEPIAETFETFEDATGQMEDLEDVHHIPTGDRGLRQRGFIEKWIGTNGRTGEAFTAFRNPRTGRFTGGKPSSHR